jgi:hypothetical protein
MTYYHTRSVSAPAWGNEPSSPISPSNLPAHASPHVERTMTTPERVSRVRSRLHLTPRPPVFSAIAGYQDVPAAAESSSFALLERRRNDQVAVFRPLPAAALLPQSAGLAERRGREGLRLVLVEEEKGICGERCCAPWSV